MTDPRTRLAHALNGFDAATGAVVPPLHLATTFARDGAYALRAAENNYIRNASPTVDLAERVLADLDGGIAARLFASGIAAIACLLDSLDAGAHVVAPKVMYYGAQALMRRLAAKGRIALTLFDQNDPDALSAAIQTGRTALVWCETPSNPTWAITDIAAAAAAAHAAGANLAVDSTCAPPCTTRPLQLGADFVFHSATKYLNGHSDVLAGVLVAAAESARWHDICTLRTMTGGVPGPFDAWLLIRGLRTLFVRFERASANALAVARHFERHPRLAGVLYPGLTDHPGHAVAARQMTGGFGGMLSLLVDGDGAAALRVATRTRVFLPATSLGGVESLIEHRRTVEGPESPVPANLLRLSVGIEHEADLIADLEQALAG
ncbi:MAG: PLP-dependent aspartate aminotransferase family protein [Alphaproteobacteria bacterium]